VSVGDKEPLTNLIPLGGVVKDPRLNPRIGVDGSPLLEDGERVGYRGSHVVTISSFAAGDKRWSAATRPKKPAQVSIATGRVIFAWPDWKGDPALGSFLERRVATRLLLERDQGKLIFAAHLRPSWIYQVDVHDPSGRFKKTRTVGIRVHWHDELFAFNVEDFPPDKGELLARRLVAELAGVRLADDDLDGALKEQHGGKLTKEKGDEDRHRLGALAAGKHEPSASGWGYSVAIPCSRRVDHVG
jgi:hypothetical protein